MEITHLGHSSFLIKGSDYSIVTDPFDPTAVGIKFPQISADLVTISHDHSDHNQASNVSEVKRIISVPGEYEINNVTIRGIGSYHDEQKGKERGKNIIFVFDIEGVSICHLGDLGHELPESLIQEIGTVHVLMVPIGGDYTINSKQAVDLVQKIEPNFIIPMHFNSPGLNPEVFAKLEDEKPFLSALGLKVEQMKKLSLKQSSFPMEDQVVVLLEN